MSDKLWMRDFHRRTRIKNRLATCEFDLTPEAISNSDGRFNTDKLPDGVTGSERLVERIAKLITQLYPVCPGGEGANSGWGDPIPATVTLRIPQDAEIIAVFAADLDFPELLSAFFWDSAS